MGLEGYSWVLRSHPGQGKGRKDIKGGYERNKGSFRGHLSLNVRVSLLREYVIKAESMGLVEKLRSPRGLV